MVSRPSGASDTPERMGVVPASPWQAENEREEPGNMDFDKALEFAVTRAWNDLVPGDRLLSARVEYESTRGVLVDSLTVWTVRSWGYQDRLCDWTGASQTTPAGLRFSNGYHSDTLAEALDYIMKNQDKFARSGDAWRSHFVVIQPPAADQVAQAAAWMPGVPVESPVAVDASGDLSKAIQPHPRSTRTTFRPRTNGTNGSPELVDKRSGYPNGPWRR